MEYIKIFRQTIPMLIRNNKLLSIQYSMSYLQINITQKGIIKFLSRFEYDDIKNQLKV